MLNDDYKNEVLSICIPTKDRSDKLISTISEFYKQIGSHDARIYISDNSEDDVTEKLILEKFGYDDKIKYFSNESGSKTFQTIFQNLAIKAKGEYLWFFGDDDLPFDDALDKIFSAIDESPDFILVKYVGYDSKLENVLPYWKNKIEEDSRIYKGSFVSTLISSYPYNGFISFVIMRKKHLLKALQDKHIDLDSNYVLTFAWSIALLSLPDASLGISIGKPLVKWREEFGNSADRSWWSKSRFLLNLEHMEIFATLSEWHNSPVLLKEYDGPLQWKLIAIAISWKFRNHLYIADALKAIELYDNIKFHVKVSFLAFGLIPSDTLLIFRPLFSKIYGLMKRNSAEY